MTLDLTKKIPLLERIGFLKKYSLYLKQIDFKVDPVLWIILSFLVLASIGLAMLESTTESYFFDILGGKERYRFYGPFNTSIDFGNFVAKIFGSVLLIFLPFRYLFILFAAFMFIMFLLSFKTKKVIESKRK